MQDDDRIEEVTTTTTTRTYRSGTPCAGGRGGRAGTPSRRSTSVSSTGRPLLMGADPYDVPPDDSRSYSYDPTPSHRYSHLRQRDTLPPAVATPRARGSTPGAGYAGYVSCSTPTSARPSRPSTPMARGCARGCSEAGRSDPRRVNISTPNTRSASAVRSASVSGPLTPSRAGGGAPPTPSYMQSTPYRGGKSYQTPRKENTTVVHGSGGRNGGVGTPLGLSISFGALEPLNPAKLNATPTPIAPSTRALPVSVSAPAAPRTRAVLPPHKVQAIYDEEQPPCLHTGGDCGHDHGQQQQQHECRLCHQPVDWDSDDEGACQPSAYGAAEPCSSCDRHAIVSLIGQAYDTAMTPSMPAAVQEDTPDVWFHDYQNARIEEAERQESERQRVLQRRREETGGGVGFKIGRFFSDTSASIERSVKGASESREVTVWEKHHGRSRIRLAKYWPYFCTDDLICGFECEGLHNNRPIKGHLLLTTSALCYVGKNKNDNLLIVDTFPLTGIASYTKGVSVPCYERNWRWVMDLPNDLVVADTMQIYMRNGHLYHFTNVVHPIIKREVNVPGGYVRDGHDDVLQIDRFINYLDHAWRAASGWSKVPQMFEEEADTMPTPPDLRW